MPREPDAFRDFGLLAEGLPPPPEKVRCFLSRGRILGQYLGTGFVAALGLGLMLLCALLLPLTLSLLACAATLIAFAAFEYLMTRHDYRWVELEGNCLRAKHLYSGRLIEHSLQEIECLVTMAYQVRRIETLVLESLMGRVKGVEVRFRRGHTPLRIMRADPAMTNAQELIEAILFKMTQMGEVDAEIVNHAGKPLVRQIHWKGDIPKTRSTTNLKVCLGAFMFLALLFGSLLAFCSVQEQQRHLLTAVPPHDITLQALIQKGPGTNRYVTVTDFLAGGYVAETKYGSWSCVWVALFPNGRPGQAANKQVQQPKEIQVVLSTKAVGSETALKRMLQQGRVTGLCSEAPQSSWGMTLGPKLTEVNSGLPLSSAWSIQEQREPTSAAVGYVMFISSIICYTVVLVLAVIIFRIVS